LDEEKLKGVINLRRLPKKIGEFIKKLKQE
jgi:hypothetical protein